MKTPSILLAVAGLSLVLGACSGNEEPADSGDTVEIPTADIPSQEEADAQAAEEITEDNADQALEDLEAEILGDG